MKTMRACGILGWLCCAMFVAVNCTSDAASSLEDAKFALDNEDFSAAVSAATTALDAEPDNAEAARILASAYMGRGGFNMHDIAVELLSLENADDSNYRALAPILPDDGDLSDMKNAVETLEGLEGINEDELATDALKDAAYDLGLMEMVFHYAISIYEVNFKTDPNNYNVLLLDDDDLADARDALVNFDNHLIAAGFDPDDDTGSFLLEARKTHCLLSGVNDDEGYTVETLRALVECDLAEDPDTKTPSTFDPNFTDCGLSNPDNPNLPDYVQECFDRDTVIESF